jgi:cobalt-zinc-cadmium efflux system membrane fusion protein
LKARLRLLNIDTQKTEDGIIADEIHIIAAIDGYVSRLDAVSGQYVNPGNEVIEQINSAKFLLKIQVFEQDLGKLKSGQNVVISNASKQFIYPAVLKTIGKSVDPLTHTIECLATIQAPETSELVNGMILSAHITYSEREAKTLPDQALIKSGKQLYILVKESETAEKITFIKTKITAGVSQGGYTEILNSKDLQNVLLNGVSDIPLEE